MAPKTAHFQGNTVPCESVFRLTRLIASIRFLPMLAESNLAAKFTARARQGLFAENQASLFSITCHADCYVGKD
jgi:hypothetical protein